VKVFRGPRRADGRLRGSPSAGLASTLDCLCSVGLPTPVSILSELVVSIGWLAIIAFLTIPRLLINDFFSIDMLAIQSIFPAELIFDVNGIK